MASGSSNRGLGTKRKPKPMDDWERSWLEHWSKAGTAGYELPKIGAVGAEAAFLTEVRTPEKEKDFEAIVSGLHIYPQPVV